MASPLSLEEPLGALLSMSFFESSTSSDDGSVVPWYKRSFVFRGLMAALCGGFFFDYRADLLINTAHFYIFLVLLYLPFAVHTVRWRSGMGGGDDGVTGVMVMSSSDIIWCHLVWSCRGCFKQFVTY